MPKSGVAKDGELDAEIIKYPRGLSFNISFCDFKETPVNRIFGDTFVTGLAGIRECKSG
jgi:hypothetical protein